MLSIDTIAPDFSGTLDDGTTFTLSDWVGLKHVALYFYIKDFTKGWEIEARGFRDAYEAIESTHGLLIGVSADSVESHRRFREANHLPFPLLADPAREIMKRYGVQRRIPLLPNRRVTYLIDKARAIRGVYHHELAFRNHVEQVVEGLRRLQAAS